MLFDKYNLIWSLKRSPLNENGKKRNLEKFQRKEMNLEKNKMEFGKN